MMEKPDDIPQDVWDAADAVFEVGSALGSEAQLIISSAILAERERCASVADAERIECPLGDDESYNLAIDHVIAAIQSGSGT